MLSEFHGRHFRAAVLSPIRICAEFLPTDEPLGENRRLLIGRTSPKNTPSNQRPCSTLRWSGIPISRGCPKGPAVRSQLAGHRRGAHFIDYISLRDNRRENRLQHRCRPTPRFTAPDMYPTQYEKTLFHRKLMELGLAIGFSEQMDFMLDELSLSTNCSQPFQRSGEPSAAEPRVRTGAKAICPRTVELRDRVFTRTKPLRMAFFPLPRSETNGIEDARFVPFHPRRRSHLLLRHVHGLRRRVTLPQMLETDDFLHFKISTLNGPEVQNKGSHSFPRMVNGHYAMLSRQDNENIFLMYSDMLHFWYTKQ